MNFDQQFAKLLQEWDHIVIDRVRLAQKQAEEVKDIMEGSLQTGMKDRLLDEEAAPYKINTEGIAESMQANEVARNNLVVERNRANFWKIAIIGLLAVCLTVAFCWFFIGSTKK